MPQAKCEEHKMLRYLQNMRLSCALLHKSSWPRQQNSFHVVLHIFQIQLFQPETVFSTLVFHWYLMFYRSGLRFNDNNLNFVKFFIIPPGLPFLGKAEICEIHISFSPTCSTNRVKLLKNSERVVNTVQCHFI